MKMLHRLRAAFSRSVFPHEMAFVLEMPWRRLVLSPGELARRLPLQPTHQVLEVGAGSGYYSAEIARRVRDGRVVLLDLQAGMLERARAKLQATSLGDWAVTQADASALPYADQAFDLIVLVTVLGEIANQPRFLAEAHRVLRPGGCLCVAEHWPDPDYLTLRRVHGLAEPCGFRLEACEGPFWSYTARFRKPGAGRP